MLLDTSGLLCYHHRHEPGHQESVRLMRGATRRLTHNYIVTEFVTLAHVRGIPRGPVLDFLSDLESSFLVEKVHVDPELHHLGLDLLRRRADKNYSLCDAVSFLLMRRHGITEALTTDHHFEQEGFVRLLRT